MELNVGDLCKHFKGKNLIEKNIYEIIAKGVIYTGENTKELLDNLVVYRNIFQENKFFTREYNDLIEELSQEKKEQYGQVYRVQKLTQEEIDLVRSSKFVQEKINYMNSREEK